MIATTAATTRNNTMADNNWDWIAGGLAAAGAILVGLRKYMTSWQKENTEEQKARAETDVVQLLRDEVQRLSEANRNLTQQVQELTRANHELQETVQKLNLKLIALQAPRFVQGLDPFPTGDDDATHP